MSKVLYEGKRKGQPGDVGMIIECPRCKAAYDINKAKIPPNGAYVRCKTCETRFFIPSSSNDEATSAPGAIIKSSPDSFRSNRERLLEYAESEQKRTESTINRKGFIVRAWRGYEPLWKVFWIYNVLFYALIAMSLRILSMALSPSITASAIYGLAVFVLVMVYGLWTWVSIWTCSAKSNLVVKILARIYVIIAIVVNSLYSLSLLAIRGTSQ